MNRLILIVVSLIFCVTTQAKEEILKLGRFEQITIYGTEKKSPDQLILFLSEFK